MKFYDGEVVTCNTSRYRVQGERLGRGAVSDVYLALLDDREDARVVLKVVRDDAADDIGKAEALQHEAEVLMQLNQAEDDAWQHLRDAPSRYRRAQETAARRRVIAMLDTGDITPGQPLVVQEIAPPALERFDVIAPADERRVFAIAQAIVDVIALVHRNNMSLKDFEPTTKGDRFRVQWRDEDQRDFIFKMIDWNITGGPAAMAQDLFFFGGHLYYLLTGRHVPLDAEGHPPASLGMGNPAWNTLTTGSRQIVARLLHRDTKRRYPRVDVLADDIAWWNDLLAQTETPGFFRRLDDRLWQAKPAARYDRVLAIADLALHLELPADMRQSFEQSRKQAHEELDKENWQPIAQAQVTLGTRAYEKADQEFAQQLKILPPESEAARLAMIYQRLARVGQLLRLQYQGADERRTPEWEALETRMIKALVERRWQDAQGALAEVVRLRPEIRNWPPLKDLENWIEGGVSYIRGVATALAEAENHVDEMAPAWLTAEGEKIKQQAEAVVLLEQVQELAPFEPEFKERLALERARLGQRRRFFNQYQQANESVNQGEAAFQQAREADEKQQDYAQAADLYQNVLRKFNAALERFEAILREDPTQRRALLFARRMQTRAEMVTSLQQQVLVLHEARQEIQIGRYDVVLNKVQSVPQLTSSRIQARELLAEAEMGAHLLEQVRTYLQGAETDLNNGKFQSALEQLRRFDGWDGRALRDLAGGQTLPGPVGARAFHLQPGLRNQAITLQQRVEVTRDVWEKVQQAVAEGDFDEVIRQSEALQTRYPLTAGLARQCEEARDCVANRLKAETLIAQAQGFDGLRLARDLLRDDKGRKAQELLRQAAEQWLLLAQALAASDLKSLKDCLSEGLKLFEQAETLFADRLRLAERAISVADSLSAEPATRPGWFRLDWQVRLARLSEDLEALAGPQSWTEMRQRAAAWRVTRQQHLEGFVQEELGQIQAQSQAHQYGAALKTLEALWDGIPTALRDDLPIAISDLLRDALRAHLAAEQNLKALLAHLAGSPDYSFQEAAREAATIPLPTHLAVPIDDLMALRADLERAAEMELTAARQPVADLEPEAGRQNYAQIIQLCRSLAVVHLDIIMKTASRGRAETLRNKLQEKTQATARNLQNALEEAVKEQTQYLTAEPDRMLALYYQVWWYQSLSLALPSTAMQSALELPKKALVAAAERLLALRDLSDFAEPEMLLARAETLNNALGYLPVEKLPPLPENVPFADVGLEWRIETGALNLFKAQVAALQKLLQAAAQIKIQTTEAAPAMESAPSAAPLYRYNAELVADLQTLARNIQQAVERLREYWQTLELPWNEDSALAQIGREAKDCETVATRLSEAWQPLQTNEAMQGLALLDKELESSESLKSLNESSLLLLAALRQALQVNYAALQQELIAALGRQIAAILAQPNAVAELQQQILIVPQSRGLGEAAYQAIRQGVDERARQARAEGRTDTAVKLWQTVLLAVHPWKRAEASEPPNGNTSSKPTSVSKPAKPPSSRAKPAGAAKPSLRRGQ